MAVYCEEYNPSWSWYAGNANATAVFEMDGGARFVYNGSWCSPGAETSWNAAWRVSGEHGTALWDGDDDPTLVGVAADDLDVRRRRAGDRRGAAGLRGGAPDRASCRRARCTRTS